MWDCFLNAKKAHSFQSNIERLNRWQRLIFWQVIYLEGNTKIISSLPFKKTKVSTLVTPQKKSIWSFLAPAAHRDCNFLGLSVQRRKKTACLLRYCRIQGVRAGEGMAATCWSYTCSIQALLKSLPSQVSLTGLFHPSEWSKTISERQVSCLCSSMWCFHFPGGGYPWILEAAPTAGPVNQSPEKLQHLIFQKNRSISPILSRYFMTWILKVCFLSPQLPGTATQSVRYLRFERTYADKSRYLNQFLHRTSKCLHRTLFRQLLCLLCHCHHRSQHCCLLRSGPDEQKQLVTKSHAKCQYPVKALIIPSL